MRRATLNRTALLLGVPTLLGAGCATIRRYEASETERMLAAAGFHMLPADTPERKEDLRSLPPHRIVSRTKDGRVVYTYADPDNCYCVYAGGDKEYSEYERLRGKYELELARRAAGSSPSGGVKRRGAVNRRLPKALLMGGNVRLSELAFSLSIRRHVACLPSVARAAKRGEGGPMGLDPVCKMEVNPASAEAQSDYEGVTFYFCSHACKEKFDREPLRYLDETDLAEARAEQAKRNRAA